MPQYIGFSTINANKPRTTNASIGIDGGPGTITQPIISGKKFKLVDEQLVIQDFLNALNIPLGQKVGQPQYGTTLWSFVFEPNTFDTQQKLETEIRRIASLDPRLQLNTVSAYPQNQGILIEIQAAVVPFNNASLLSIFFNPATNTATVQ
jgi:phage baseplate assembly protein W